MTFILLYKCQIKSEVKANILEETKDYSSPTCDLQNPNSFCMWTQQKQEEKETELSQLVIQ